jgi:hypothetical protein
MQQLLRADLAPGWAVAGQMADHSNTTAEASGTQQQFHAEDTIRLPSYQPSARGSSADADAAVVAASSRAGTDEVVEDYGRPGAGAAGIRPCDSTEPNALSGLLGSEDVDANAELSAAVAAIAAMAQLGLGGADMLYPQSLDEYYAACEDELQWRVAL